MITFRRAVRESVPLILGIAGPSGSGKTYSAMRLATGMSGGKPFAFLDTEAGRAKHYAEKFAFDHADLRPPFRPLAYAEAIHEADKAGYPVIVVDSCSHEHAGEGGLLDWHEEELDRMTRGNTDKRDNYNMAAWIKPKMDHKQMVSRLLQIRAHLILCFRAEQKIEMVKRDGRMVIEPKRIASGFSDWIPICEKNLLYELTASFLLTPDAPGMPKPIKLQEQLRGFVALNAPLDEQAGQKMAAWALGGVPVHRQEMQEPGRQDVPKPTDALSWDALADIYDQHNGGRKARTLPMETVTEWADKRTDLFTLGTDGTFHFKTQEPARQTATETAEEPRSPAVFTWRLGTHKGRSVLDIELDYLIWACTNIRSQDHRDAALAEVNRRQAQDVMAFDGRNSI